MDTAFPSKYIKAADLKGKTVPVQISHVEMEQVGRTGDKQPVIYFKGKTKGMVLNKTNNNALVKAFGYDSDDWEGETIHLVERMVEYQGEEVPGLRVHIPNRNVSVNHQATVGREDRARRDAAFKSDDELEAEGVNPRKFDKQLDDEIPF